MEALLPLAEKIGARLKERGETIGIAESSTGGLLSAALLSSWWRLGLFSRWRGDLHGLCPQGVPGDPQSPAGPHRACLDRTLCPAAG